MYIKRKLAAKFHYLDTWKSVGLHRTPRGQSSKTECGCPSDRGIKNGHNSCPEKEKESVCVRACVRACIQTDRQRQRETERKTQRERLRETETKRETEKRVLFLNPVLFNTQQSAHKMLIITSLKLGWKEWYFFCHLNQQYSDSLYST